MITILLALLDAHATVPDYANLSFVGLGTTPTTSSLLDRTKPREVAVLQTSASVSQKGDMGWSVPLPGFPGLVTVPLSITYTGAPGGYVGRGFDVVAGPSVSRVTGRSRVGPYADVDDPHLLQGAGLDGLLSGDGADWVWSSSSPGELAADYDAVTQVWELDRERTVWTLEPDAPATAPLRWHAVHEEDRYGNAADLEWTGGRLDEVTWGGNVSTSDPSNVVIGFEYGPATASWRSSAEGVTTVVDDRLESIVFAVGGADVLYWDFVYDTTDGDDRLVEILATDATSPATRPVARFEWTLWSGASLPLDETQAPPELMRCHGYGSLTTCEEGLFDMSGDGLLDHLDQVSTGWLVWEDGTWLPTWEDDELAGHSLANAAGDFSSTTSVPIVVVNSNDGPLVTGSYQTERMIDLNGDGIQDRVTSIEVPFDVSPYDGEYPAGDMQALNEDVDSHTWTVRYGEREFGYGVERAVTAPFKWPSIGRNFTLPTVPYDQIALSYPLESGLVDLMDMNGDGWLDVVKAGVASLEVWLAIPEVGAGWAATPMQWISDPTTPIFSLEGRVGYTEKSDIEIVPGFAEETPRIAETEVVRGLRDLNGDGLPDFVDTELQPGTSAWRVWFNTGTGLASTYVEWPAPVPWLSYSDEGITSVTSCSISGMHPDFQVLDHLQPGPDAIDVTLRDAPTTNCTPLTGVTAEPQEVRGTLADVDADGLADILDAFGGYWWRNVGDGFDAAPRLLPAWMPAFVDRIEGHQTTVSSESLGQDAGSVSALVSHRVGTGRLADLDGDGLLDAIDASYPGDFDPIEFVSGVVGDGDRTGLLRSIEIGSGAITEVLWTSSGQMYPSGNAIGGHEAGSTRPVVSRVLVLDPVTGHAAEQWHSYVDGVTEESQWLGFREKTVTDIRYDGGEWELLDGTWINLLGTPFTLAETTTAWELRRDGSLPLEVEIATDHAHAWLPQSGVPVVPEILPRFITAWTYEDQGASPFSRRVVLVENTEYGEGVDQTGRIDTVDVAWDADGYPVMVTTDGPDVHDEIEVSLTWARTSDQLSKVAIRQVTNSWDQNFAAAGTFGAVEDISFLYDELPYGQVGAGASSSQEVCSGPVATLCSEQLEWTWFRNARGVIDERYGPDGSSWIALEMGWGDTIPTRTTNALGHETLVVLDAQGRVEDEIDPNLVTVRTIRDAFGRPLSAYKEGKGSGKIYQTHEWVWHDDVVPAWVESTELVHDPVVGGYSTATSYEVFDGFGAVVQSWQPDETDAAWVVSESERDVGGHQVSTTKPHRETVFDATYTVKGAPLARNWVDALGEVRYSVEDEEGPDDLGQTTSLVTAPGVREVVDGSGWVKRTTTDVHGRTVSVEGGTTSTALELEGSYLWDGRGRLTRFTDGNGGQWRYQHDGAGRLRTTDRAAAAGPVTPYLSFDYVGAMPVKQWDQTGASSKEVARFTWDLAGRETQHQLFDDLTGTWQTWTTTWDTLWKGAKTSEVDPAGTMTWEYAAGPFGRFGQPTRARRTFTGFAATPVFEWRYDFAGREVSKTWPSGEVVATTWSASGKRLTSSVAAGPTVTWTWDQWGLSSGFGSTANVASEITRLTPGRIRTIDMNYIDAVGVPQLHWLKLDYHDNGLLYRKTIPNLEPFTYEYDKHQRIVELRQHAFNKQETYTYDAIGNLLTSWRKDVAGNDWVYAATTRFSETPQRSRWNPAGKFVLEVQAWDTQGRLATTTTTEAGAPKESRSYVYDGAGHLRRQSVLPAGGIVTSTTFQYDNSDAAVVEKTVTAAFTKSTLRFLDWELDVATGEVKEPLLPMYRRLGATYRWVMLEPDGHALLVLDATGNWTHDEMMGVQGNALGQYTHGAAWPMDGQHGDRPNLTTGLIGRGVRTTLLRDGTWLQPEPFLRYGPTVIAGMAPHLTQGVYASGNTNSFADKNGYNPLAVAYVFAETAYTVVSIKAGAVDTKAAWKAGSYGVAVVTGVGVAVDAVSLASPIPAVGGVAAKGATKMMSAASNALGSLATTGAKVADKVGDASKGQSFYRGAKAGEAPSFTPRPSEFKVDPSTGTVKPTHGVSVFDNPNSVSGKGFVPHEVDQATIPSTLQVKQRGSDPAHFEIMPADGADLTPDQFKSACEGIGCK